MPSPKLHLDADTADKELWRALLQRGHDVSRTPTDWVECDATDEEQLLAATAQGRCIFTYNVRHFSELAARHPHHCGIVLAAQSRWTLTSLITALDRLLTETSAGDWRGQVRRLNDWR